MPSFHCWERLLSFLRLVWCSTRVAGEIFWEKQCWTFFLNFVCVNLCTKGLRFNSAKCTSLCLLAGIIFLFSKIFLNKRRTNQSLCDGSVCSLNQEISVREVVWICSCVVSWLLGVLWSLPVKNCFQKNSNV